MKTFLSIILWVWQLPQNLAALLFLAWLRPEHSFLFGDGEPLVRLYYADRMRGGISLGRYIFMAANYKDYLGATEAHELGHCRQSLLLGPLYLIVVGLPSLLWAAWWNEGRKVDYYSFYTEKWADRLGGVSR